MKKGVMIRETEHYKNGPQGKKTKEEEALESIKAKFAGKRFDDLKRAEKDELLEFMVVHMGLIEG